MLRDRTRWQGAALIAITYVYFLIFAQFAFLKRLAEPGVAGAHLNGVMAAMALGGVLASLSAPRLRHWPAPTLRLCTGLAMAAAAALLSLLPIGWMAAIAIAFLTGAGLGLLTVTLATHLRHWTGNRNALLLVGLGTGVGYFICNIPAVFNASAEEQTVIAALLCAVGIPIALRATPAPAEAAEKPAVSALSFLHVLACLTALVWLDSAAFFIIQNTPVLKAGTWQGAHHLWGNGGLHFAAAVASAWLLAQGRLWSILCGALFALGCACLLLLDPGRAALASVFYPIGVSLYSVALVAYPSLLAPASSVAERGRMAGWIYAVAGWFGSAMGIGMGQHLGHVPPAFVGAASAIVLTPWLIRAVRGHGRELALTGAAALAAFGLDRALHEGGAVPALSQVERGRQVYISEGCIHCHSQYVRPNSPDVLMWGPVETLQAVREQNPPLIGNRRQGPDLAEVGARRSPLWLKAHFYDPREVSGASIMPSFGFLFRDGRGDDLVAYLASLRGGDVQGHIAEEDAWTPAPEALHDADPRLGQRLIEQDCATCHSAKGRTREAWQSSFKHLPADLVHGPFRYLKAGDTQEDQAIRIARIAKFGIPGTDMPGHEYLSDREIASIGAWLSHAIAQPGQQP